MISKLQYEEKRKKTLEYFQKAHITLSEQEKNKVEVSDFGLEDLENTALQLIVYVNTSRVCAKEMVLLPGQACPEHRHPPFANYPGKEETFRCRYGVVYLYIEGEKTEPCAVEPPQKGRQYYTVFHEVRLLPGQQFTIPINTRHWFKAGDEGAVISEFSTPSFDEKDIFTNPAIRRIPEIE